MDDNRREETITALLEEKESLDMAKDYRRMSASEFFAKYEKQMLIPVGHYHVNDRCKFDPKFLEKIDYGIETLDWIK